MSAIRVLIVDASPVTRQTLTAILASDPGIEVSGAAADPYIAARRIQKDVPDVIIKPEVGSREFLMESQVRICDVVKAAAVARIRRSPRSAQTHQPKLTADA